LRIPTDKPPPHPGETLREDFLPELGWTPEELAARLRIPVDCALDLLSERIPVSSELALRLARLFGQSPAFWMNLQLVCDLYEAQHSASAPDILEIQPLRKMRKAG
jgi:antitoxin HigA-1